MCGHICIYIHVAVCVAIHVCIRISSVYFLCVCQCMFFLADTADHNISNINGTQPVSLHSPDDEIGIHYYV